MAASSRRVRIPDKPNKSIGVWGIIKNFIGKEITKVSLPVNFAEPLSMLQRLTEDFDYADVLHQAANMSDELQLAYVAAFAVSSYSTTADRVTKPFNPLLGETFECDRSNDLGWKCFSEQVSHHPPKAAMHCEGKEWIAWQDFSMSSKFRGKYLRVMPQGIFHLRFKKGNNHYTWNKVVTTVHNLILGNLWVDQTGSMVITNHNTGWKCVIEFLPYNFYNKQEQRCVKGRILDSEEHVKWIVSGRWDSEISVASVISADDTNTTFKTGPPTVLWVRRPLAADARNYYNFTLLACQLNEPEHGVAPTDSRFRPDQRMMEEGNWDEANVLKISLEEQQRTRKQSKTRQQPLWFTLQDDPFSDLKIHIFNGKYWQCKKKQDWSNCPQIF